jgi:hypothetical protein
MALRPARAGPAACRGCGAALDGPVADLGLLPAGAALLPPERLDAPETLHPRRLACCGECGLVQALGTAPEPAEPPAAPDIDAAALCRRFGLDGATQVALLAPGWLPLRAGLEAAGVPVLACARFGAASARRMLADGHAPVLLLAGDALARAADPHDVAAGIRLLLAPGGAAMLDLPWLLPVLRDRAHDALAAPGGALFALSSAEQLLAQHGLAVFEAEKRAGSLRLLLRHAEDRLPQVGLAVAELRRAEALAGLDRAAAWPGMAAGLVDAKCALLDFLVGLRRAGRGVAGFGTDAAANAFLAYCGVGSELLPFTVDPDPALRGMCLPGTRIPVRAPDALEQARPDFVLVLPWRRRDAAMRQTAGIAAWGGRHAVAIPTLQIL